MHKVIEMLNHRGACVNDTGVHRDGTTAVELETRMNIGRLHTIKTNLVSLKLLTSEFDIQHDIEYTYDKMTRVLVNNLSDVATKVTKGLVDILKDFPNDPDSFDVSSVTPGLRPDVFGTLLFTDAVNMFDTLQTNIGNGNNDCLDEILKDIRTNLVDVNCKKNPYTLSPAQYMEAWDAMRGLVSGKPNAPDKASKLKGGSSTSKKPHVSFKKKKSKGGGGGGGGKARVEYVEDSDSDSDSDGCDCEDDPLKKCEHIVFQSLTKDVLLEIATKAKEYKDGKGSKVYPSLAFKQAIPVNELKSLLIKNITLTDDFMSKCMNTDIRKNLYTKLMKKTDLDSKSFLFPKKIDDQIGVLRTLVSNSV